MEVAVLRVLIIRAVTYNAHITVIFKNRGSAGYQFCTYRH